MSDEYLNPNPEPGPQPGYDWDKHGKIRGLGRLTVVEPFDYQHPGGPNLMDRLDLFSVVAIGDLSPNQIERLLAKTNNPHPSYTFAWPKAKYKTILNFEKYIVKQINKMPEEDVGRVVKIETWNNGNNGTSTVEGICLNKYKNPNRKQFSLCYSTTMPQLNKKRKEFVKQMAIQLKVAFNR